ncbi:MAG: hypothetical protein ABI051_04010, partial [Vicinamibacterales bacterium]
LNLHVAESAHARLADGRAISGIRLIGWREGNAIRVLIFALVPRAGQPSSYTTDPGRLTRADVATYLIGMSQTVFVDELPRIGMEPLTIRLEVR